MAVAADSTDIKAELAAYTPEQFAALAQVSSYHYLRRALRLAGLLTLILGGVTTWVGLNGLSSGSSFFISAQAILGLLMIGQSLWALGFPRVSAFRGLAIIIAVSSLWSILLTPIIRLNLFTLTLGMLAFSVLLLWWAYNLYTTYQNYRATPIIKPSREIEHQYARVWEALAYPTPVLSPELMVIHLAGARRGWRTLLLPNYALIAHTRQKVLLVAGKADLLIRPMTPTAARPDQVPVLALIGKTLLSGKMYQASVQQYRTWKGDAEPDETTTKLFARKRRLRIIGRIVRFIFWFSIFLYCAQAIEFSLRAPYWVMPMR
jgi:hypothetical protein